MEPEHTHLEEEEVRHSISEAFEMDIDHREGHESLHSPHMNDFEENGGHYYEDEGPIYDDRDYYDDHYYPTHYRHGHGYSQEEEHESPHLYNQDWPTYHDQYISRDRRLDDHHRHEHEDLSQGWHPTVYTEDHRLGIKHRRRRHKRPLHYEEESFHDEHYYLPSVHEDRHYYDEPTSYDAHHSYDSDQDYWSDE